MRWKMALACYSFDIVYLPGAETIALDTFFRSFCAAVPAGLNLFDLHNHFVTVELPVCSTSCRLRTYHSL